MNQTQGDIETVQRYFLIVYRFAYRNWELTTESALIRE